MFSVLVLANESLLADAIVAALSQEIELNVVRMSYLEPEKRGNYPVIIIVDDGQLEGEAIKLNDLVRGDVDEMLINISLESTNIHVLESYQLFNPEMDQVLTLLREFSSKYLKDRTGKKPRLQKKMNKVGYLTPGEHTREDVNVPVKCLFGNVRATNPNKNVKFLFPFLVRRNFSGNVTLISRMNVKN